MKAETIFEKLWTQYADGNPSAGKIHDLFAKSGNRVINDHVAFRTFDDPRVGIDVLARPFIEAGFEPKGEYHFEAKKLRARHFELPGDPEAPRVFISELMLSEFSDSLREIVLKLLDDLPQSEFESPELICRGSLFTPLSHEVYNRLREETEYAAWLYVFGFRANHFTVSINHLKEYATIEQVNAFLKSEGFSLNSSGGEVKGTPEQMLEQSSTLADQVDIAFKEGVYRVPSCYYEFAKRYTNSDGKLFSGFIAGSADRIFESTDFR